VLDTLRYSSGELLTVNMLWVLLSLPIVTIPPSFAGLFYATNRLANQEQVTYRTFFAGFKKYFWKSYIWFLINAIVIGLLIFNINLGLSQSEALWIGQLSIVYWILLFIWSYLQMYHFPFLIEQDEPRLFLALRNSALFWLKYLIFNIFLVIIIGILITISYFIYPFWFVITLSLIAYLTNLGLIYNLSKEKGSTEGEQVR
jgi:uncharacterized membrane protein YesL